MANVPLTMNKIFEEGMKVFYDEYSKIYSQEPYAGYRLEQCGKQWRVMKYALIGGKEPKTGWLTHKEADALLKIFKAGENDGDS